MAIAAVMVANAFHAVNIRAWVGWTYFAIALGPVLVWVYTAIFSLIPPSSFATGVYGNHVFLFRSAAYWFGWIYVLIIALLPRYLFLYIKQIYFPNKIDELRLVRKYHPDIDFATHPMFNPEMQATAQESGTEGEIPMDNLQRQKSHKSHKSIKSTRSVGGRPEIVGGRASMSSARLGMNGSARGSQLDSESS
jgi:phospholipid-translocating ATPase